MTREDMIVLAVAVVTAFLVVAVIYYLVGKKQAKVLAVKFILEAERLFGSEVGQTKFKWVVHTIYSMLPGLVRAFYREEEIEKLVQTTFNILKKTALGELEDKIREKEICIPEFE